MRNMADQEQNCECGAELVFVRHVTLDETENEWRGAGDRFSGPIASSIFECPADQRRFRIFISGTRRELKPAAAARVPDDRVI